MKIYVATSWENPYYVDLRRRLLEEGYDVYDFRDPKYAFSWDELFPLAHMWSPGEYREVIKGNHITDDSFHRDFQAMQAADVFVLLMPCGRSAHVEAGWAAGEGKATFVYYPVDTPGDPEFRADLMYLLFDDIVIGWWDLAGHLKGQKRLLMMEEK